MRIKILPLFSIDEKNLASCIENFNTTGAVVCNGKRNLIKVFDLNKSSINIKSFKVPVLVNKVIYKYFRKSKARRSFDYATVLLNSGIDTPKPIAYVESYSFIGLENSYYVSEHFNSDLTFDDLVENVNYPERDTIIRQFTKFTFNLHEKGIEFRDHSATNTLIKKVTDGQYQFLLVDLNRMKFDVNMGFDRRMYNFCRLTDKEEIVATMSNEYSKLYSGHNEVEIFERMWLLNKKYYLKLRNKRRIKKILCL